MMNVKAGKWIQAHTNPQAKIGVNDAGAIRYFGQRFTHDLSGLNNASICFGKKTPGNTIPEADYLAIFPGWFFESQVAPFFDVTEIFSIPLEEYTICRSTRQNTLVVFKRKQ